MEMTKFYKYQSIAECINAYLLRLLRYLGIREGSAEHQEILTAYNRLEGTAVGLPRGHKAVKTDDWCAIFVAGLAHALGLTEIYPMECSCGKIIEIAKKMGIWIEDDSYIPVPGDWILYSWKGQEGQENTLAPNHIGAIYYTDGEIMIAVEGNKGDAVATRALAVGDKRIRGFVHPDCSQLIGKLIAPQSAAAAAVYHRVDEVPEWGRATAAKLAGRTWLQGIGADDLALTEDLLRTLVILDRGQVFEVGALPI